MAIDEGSAPPLPEPPGPLTGKKYAEAEMEPAELQDFVD